MTLRLSNMTLQPTVPGAFSKFTFVATGGQTVFTGTDANSNTLSFSNANQLVFLNGVYLREGASHDYVASGGDTITLNAGANLNDVLELFTAVAFNIADAISQATGDARYIQITAERLIRNFIDGFNCSQGADAEHDIDITAGQLVNFANTAWGTGTAMTKRIDATWAAGTAGGGMNDSETVGNTTFYGLFAIFNTSEGIDYGFDTSLTAANLLADTAVIAAGFDQGYRRIGWVRTDGAANIIGFIHYGHDDEWHYDDPDNDISADFDTTLSTTVVTVTCKAPPLVLALLNAYFTDSATSNADGELRIWPTAIVNQTAAKNTSQWKEHEDNNDFNAQVNIGGNIWIQMDSSSQVKMVAATAGTATLRTYGWRDNRGRNG